MQACTVPFTDPGGTRYSRRITQMAVILVLSAAGALGQTQDYAYVYSKQASLKPLLEVLEAAKVSGSLEFSGSCDFHDSRHFPEFPTLHPPATKGSSPLRTIRGMFADDPAIQVTEDSDGTIRMVERGVATDILNVMIGYIPFETRERGPIYSPGAAIASIYYTPEVQHFMKVRNIEEWTFLANGIVGGRPAEPERHISGPLANVTFSEALDYVLKGFPGIWAYQNCPPRGKQRRSIHVWFYHLNRLGMVQ